MDSKEPAAPGASAVGEPPAWAVSTQFALTQFGATEAAARPQPPSPFDVCHVGVVLRVVLGVQVVVALGASFGSASLLDAIGRWMQASAVALPGCLVWLVLACASRRWLARCSEPVQWAFAAGLGAVAGLVGMAQALWLDWALGGIRPSMWSVVPPMATGAALASVGLAWLRHRSRSELPAHAAARLAELQARIRPHFLFNTLNTAIALVQIDPQRAESVLEDLAELFRQALVSPTMRATLRDEVDLAQRYLGIEQLRFGDRMTVRWELDAEGQDAELPALILQPLVENAVRHGIEPAPGPGWIVVRTRVHAGRVELSVRNSVIDAAAAPGAARTGHGMALRNVRQRLKLMHDVEAEFEAGQQRSEDGRQPGVYVVRLSVPLPRARA
ncbi:histidine kinase [uncultured Aquabacterium sp.]|uniref:sensor histidine kinase n=1 Tax=Aquabacterium sp. TaxID=1872578 RepID=UPI0025CF5F3C|nr:histidine kinase [uncultured Aquabacterium sp.]